MPILKLLLLLVVFATLFGCDTATNRPTEGTRETSGTVAVVGDATASVVREQLGKRSVQTSSTLDDQAKSSLLIVVQDSTVGPMPIHLEIAKKLHKRPGRDYLWVFTNTKMVDDQELLELEVLECREIFNSQGLPGDTIQFAFDSPRALVRSDYACPKGWEEIIRYVRSTVK